jgi:hypothetical protein
MTFRLLGVVSQKHQPSLLLMDTTYIGLLSQQMRTYMSKDLQDKLDAVAKILEPILWETLAEIEEQE